MSDPLIEIAGRPIGPGHPPYIIAEMSGNHNRDINRAFALLEAAKQAGADAVKLQTYTADTITIDHDAPEFRIKGGLWDGETLYALYQKAHTPWDWHPALFAKARELGLAIFSSPFDPTAIDFLESLDAPAYKIASFEVVDLPLIQRAARTGKPLIISTGIADLDEIGEAVNAARSAGASQIALLHCTSGYPTPPEESDLRTIPDLAATFDVVAGLSDHTLGTAVPVAAIALGAALIEKHFTVNRDEDIKNHVVDADFSLNPDELGRMVNDCRIAWGALGQVNYQLKPSETGSKTFRRSLYAVAEIPAGAAFTAQNVRSIRPGFGLAPKHLPEILGRRASRAIARGTPMDWSLVAKD
jgi:N-acetylneuraminate synthase